MPDFEDEPTFGFLSRLCGGEVAVSDITQGFMFLSRLCGGEGSIAIRDVTINFLSRLCGGEENPTV